MRSIGHVSLLLATLSAAAACTTPVVVENGAGTSATHTTTSKKKAPPKASSSDDSAGDDDDATAATSPASNPAPTAAKFACSGAGIAAFADALVNAGKKSCTSDGTGVVKNDNYQCVKTAIDQVAPPNPDKAYEIVTTLLAPNQDFPNLECTYFIQMVTAGVCGTPLSPSDMKWQDYPLAHEFIGKAPAGWTWLANDGTSEVQVGDIFVYDATSSQDPGHIMIVAAVNGKNFRIAEANELNVDGTPALQGETGVMSNTRVTSLSDPDQRPAGWFRLKK